MGSDTIKCQKCRHVLLEEACTSDNNLTCDPLTCDSYDIKKFIYINEDRVPLWIKDKVESEQWTKGKLHCGNCRCRVGSFDYISGRKCDCGNSVLPPIHLVTSQVDRPLRININNINS